MSATGAYIGSEEGFKLRVREGTTQEMEDALSRYQTALYRKAYHNLRNEFDAEDAVQDALVSAYKSLDQFKGQAQICTWLTAIVINCARMHLRRRPRQTVLSLDERFGEDEQFCLSDILADATPSPRSQVPRVGTASAAHAMCGAALAFAAQGIRVARPGRTNHARGSAHSRRARGNREGTSLPRTRQAQTANEPNAR